MSMYKQFETDPELERLGIILDYGDYRIKIARAGGKNKNFEKTMDRIAKPYRRALATETMDNDRAEDLMREGYAESVILHWEVVTDRDEKTGERIFTTGLDDPEGGPPLPFNKANVLAALIALPDLFADIKEQAVKSALFRKTVQETEAGN